MQELLNITKALADESRMRVLTWLRDGEMCLCQIVAMLQLAPSTVSRHMAVLQQAGLVVTRKDGRWMFYRLPGREASASIRQTLKWLDKLVEQDADLSDDLKRLAQVRAQDPSELCDITYGKSE